MKNVNNFYNKSQEYDKPSGLLQGFFNMNYAKTIEKKTAIDLGAGTGNDALYLINKGFNVTCIDKEEKSKEIIESKIKDKDKLKIIIDNFENVKLEKSNLIYSCLSLQYCNPSKKAEVMNKITSSINKNGFFVRKFLRKRR